MDISSWKDNITQIVKIVTLTLKYTRLVGKSPSTKARLTLLVKGWLDTKIVPRVRAQKRSHWFNPLET